MKSGFAGRFAALAVAAAVAGSAVLLPAQPAQAGDAFGAGLLGFAIGSLLAPRPVYVAPAYPVYAAPPPVVVYEQPAYPVYAAPAYPRPYYAPYQRRPLSQVAPQPGGPKVVTYDNSVASADLEPWSPGWYDYCRGRFKTFEAKSGTYMGYDGQRHFCEVN
jgi:BA14K-like protein